ncbi:hypothetical protein F7D95_08125 [Prevotella copri]|uniref:Uncharacterized protein n=1 Tax=Segatella copri TaxID=165179 RepID=A0AA90UGL3_9BACT|nr:hypothetical protein [Segatella copri]MQN12786.1 hypothetical protein [Segatella copri]
MAVNNNQNPQQQKKGAPIAINGYPQAVHDMMRAKYPDYDQVMGLGNQTMQGAPSGQTPAVAPQPMNMNVFQQNGGVSGKLETPAVQTQQVQTAASSVQTPYLGDAAEKTQQPQTSFEGMQQPPTGWKADGTPSYDALSSALSGYQTAQSKQVPEFQADPSQRDGGFFGWLGKLIPKNRPGMREGETPDEYDRRITTNRERIAAFADAIRHMGNIVNTSKGAPLQVFNDPTAMMEEGYQKRKAQRQKQDAIDADAAYKQANLDLKSAAARADQAYKLYLAGLRGDNAQLAKDKFEYRKGKDAATAQYKQEKDQRDFEYKQGRDRAKDEQTNRRLNISQYNATHKGSGRGRSGGGGSSSAKYVTWDAEGKPHYASNKTMYEANEAYYNGNTSGSSSTSSSKEVFNRDGSTTRTTNRQGGSSVAQRAGAQRRQREEARKRASKPAGKSKNGYKNTKKLGL